MKRGNSLGVAGAVPLVAAQVATRDTRLNLVFILSLVSLIGADALASGRTPHEQLARMFDALRSLSYEGTFVYLHESKLETLRIVHRVEDGQVEERLVSLNGPVRTLTREKGNVTCKLSDAHPISVPGHGFGGNALHSSALDFESLKRYYLVRDLGTVRVAGRQADVVGIIPRDDLRYGYRFYLDRESGLPLKSDLIGQQPDPIEQIMFTSLDLLPATEPPTHDTPPLLERPADDRAPDLSGLPWRFSALPPGFTLVRHHNRLDAGDQPMQHFVLSDGLASISVYVESDPRQGLEGGTRIGAVHAVGNRVSGHQVTVVGEVPMKTVEAVLAGIRYVPGEGP